jgi:glucokinase
MLLAGDIGGTKTDLAVFSAEKGPRSPLAQARFHSADYPSLEAMAREFLGHVSLPVNRACFGVAGPVVGGRARLTNLPWFLEEMILREALNLQAARLLNDLEAIANAVPHLLPSDLHTLSTGVPVTGGTIAVIAPGTGLGEAFLTWEGTDYHAHPSEGGHADFAPISPAEIELLRYLQVRFGHVSCERVCSGSGIPNLYDYLKHSGAALPSSEVAARLAAAEDRTPLILQAALDSQRPCPLCAATLRLFISILGAEAGNLALKVLATGGVYLGGGIPPRILPALADGSFLEAFRRKGRLAELLARVPVQVITSRVALIGAASYGLRLPAKDREPDATEG